MSSRPDTRNVASTLLAVRVIRADDLCLDPGTSLGKLEEDHVSELEPLDLDIERHGPR